MQNGGDSEYPAVLIWLQMMFSFNSLQYPTCQQEHTNSNKQSQRIMNNIIKFKQSSMENKLTNFDKNWQKNTNSNS